MLEMVSIKIVIVTLFVIFLSSKESDGHARLMDPVNRGSAWRKGFNTPKNYDDHGNNCGGFSTQFNKNKGKCGVCGDDYSISRPRDNENTGKYGTGLIVRRYSPGQKITLQVEVSSNHLGYFEFSLCKLNFTKQLETEECFDAHQIYLTNGERRYILPNGVYGFLNIKVQLPSNIICKHCVLRWHYTSGNNWGICEDGTGKLGCGNQETFRTCSDISIL